jgi:hypothetical protein
MTDKRRLGQRLYHLQYEEASAMPNALLRLSIRDQSHSTASETGNESVCAGCKDVEG